MTPAESAELSRLDALAASLYRAGQPGMGEEFDRARLLIARILRERDAERAESGRLVAAMKVMRGAGGDILAARDGVLPPGVPGKLAGVPGKPRTPGGRKDVGKARKGA